MWARESDIHNRSVLFAKRSLSFGSKHSSFIAPLKIINTDKNFTSGQGNGKYKFVLYRHFQPNIPLFFFSPNCLSLKIINTLPTGLPNRSPRNYSIIFGDLCLAVFNSASRWNKWKKKSAYCKQRQIALIAFQCPGKRPWASRVFKNS